MYLRRYQVLVLIVCMPNLVKNIKSSWKVTITGFVEGSTCLHFMGDNFQIAYEYVMKHVDLCKSKEFHCNMESSLVAGAIKCVQKMGISVVICNTDGMCLFPVLENAKNVNITVLVIHSLFVKEIDRAIDLLRCSPHSRQLKLPSQNIKDQLKKSIKQFSSQYLVSLQVLTDDIVIQGYVEDDVIAIYEKIKELIDDLSKDTIEYTNSREEIQFLRYIMFYKPIEQAKGLLSGLSESLSLKIQKTKTSFSLTGNPIAITKGIKQIEQLLDNFQVETVRFRCHPDFLQLINESVKEPIERELNVVIYYFSVNGSEQLEPSKTVMIYVKVYSTDSTDFKKAFDIVHVSDLANLCNPACMSANLLIIILIVFM